MITYFAVLINFMSSKPPPTEAIQARLDVITLDWLRLAVGQYIVATEQSAESIYSQIRSVIDQNDLILIVEVNPKNRFGWAQQVAIDWFNRHSP
jgi:hypothetical protein